MYSTCTEVITCEIPLSIRNHVTEGETEQHEKIERIYFKNNLIVLKVLIAHEPFQEFITNQIACLFLPLVWLHS